MAIDYSIKIGKPTFLTGIYGCDDTMAKYLCQVRSERDRYKTDNQVLKAHIDVSPDGALFLETFADWQEKLKV